MTSSPVDKTAYRLVTYDDTVHRSQVVQLWRQVFGYETAHNEPNLAIDKKIAVQDGLFYVALDGDMVVGTVMAGYDGHRGWIYSMAVHLDYRNKGIGTSLLCHAEEALIALGCLKINLQVLVDNQAVQSFYSERGYAVEERISMGKRLFP